MPENRQRFSNTNNGSKRGSPAEHRPPVDPAPRAEIPSYTPTLAPNPNARAAERPARYGSSFEARFGRVILQHGIAAIPSAIFHYQGEIGLKAQHVWFISYILSHKWDDDLPYPSLSNMARCAGVTLRNIQFIKSDLCRAGMLAVTERYNGKGGRDSNAYDFSGLFAHLEDLISEDAGEPNRISADILPTPATRATPATLAKDTEAAILSEIDSSFVARFGRVIARRGVAAVPRAIFTHQKVLGLTPQQVWFVSYIFSFQWSTALPYPSINKMVQHTGYSRAHLHTIKAELVSAGYLRLVHRTNSQGGQDSNSYDFSGLLDAIREQLQPDEAITDAPGKINDDEPASTRGRHLFSPRRGQSGAMQRTRESVSEGGSEGAPEQVKSNPYEAKHTGVYESQWTNPHEQEQTRVYESQQIPVYEAEQTPLYESRQRGPVHADSDRPTNGRGPGTMKAGGHESESGQEETNNKNNDSNQRSPKSNLNTKVARVPIPGYSSYIADVARDFSRELGDFEHEASNMKQTMNLWQASSLDEQRFVELMHEARKLTRKYQSRPTWDEMNNKMAYYFATLRDLLALHGST